MPQLAFEGYSHKFRLHKKADILQVIKATQSIYFGVLQVKYRKNGLDHSRILPCVRKKLGSAPARNRVKRIMRESFRKHQEIKKVGYDLAVFCFSCEKMSLDLANHMWDKLQNELTRAK